MITLQKLTWSNCFSYGEGNELLLDENTLTQIVGLNGTGKSSIPLIIEEVLFNKNSKGIKKSEIPNREVNKGYSICLNFTKDGEEYKIDVDRKSSLKAKLYKNGEDISSHTATNTYKTVQEILGLDFKTFSQLVYQNTNSSLQFLTATDTTRKKFLIDLLQLGDYVKFFEVFKAACSEVNTEVTAISSEIKTVNDWLSRNKIEDEYELELLPIEDYTELQTQYSNLKNSVDSVDQDNKKILRNNEYKDLLKTIDLDRAKKIEISKKESYDALQSELGSVKAEANIAIRTIKKIKELGSTCHTCGQDITQEFKETSLKNEQDTLSQEKDKISQLEEEINEIKKRNKLYDFKLDTEQKWESIYRSIDESLPSNPMDKGELEASLGRVRDELRRAKRAAQEIQRENRERSEHNTRLKVIKEQIQDFQERLSIAESKLNKQQEKASALEVLKKSFSTNGLLAYKIENLVKELEELVNNYLGELSDGRFTLEFVVLKDKLNVVVTDNGKPVEILALSSGELARVNTATLLAIRKLMSSISKSRLNILFLDEVINVLDEAGKEKLVEVLLKEENLNTYIVSHQWTHPLLAKLNIVKHNNISEIELL